MWEKITDLLRFNRTLAVGLFFLGGFGVMVLFHGFSQVSEFWSQVIAGITITPLIALAFVRTFWPGKKKGGNS